jgi:hypothetical protein
MVEGLPSKYEDLSSNSSIAKERKSMSHHETDKTCSKLQNSSQTEFIIKLITKIIHFLSESYPQMTFKILKIIVL